MTEFVGVIPSQCSVMSGGDFTPEIQSLFDSSICPLLPTDAAATLISSHGELQNNTELIQHLCMSCKKQLQDKHSGNICTRAKIENSKVASNNVLT